MSREVPCPICGEQRLFFARYPNALCNSCGYSKELVDSDGNPVEFTVRYDGCGIISLHNENGTIVERDEPICFLNGVECYAAEARFGGIAVQILVPCPMCHMLHVAQAERHLGGLCYECVDKLVDTNGNHVKFDYEDRLNHTGIVSRHDENDEWIKKRDRTCFLNGKQCYVYQNDDGIIVRLAE